MTEQGIIDCISALKSNYGGFDFSENELVSYVKLWDIQFKDYSDSIVSSAIMRLIATAEFRPNIAVIKKDIANNLVDSRDEFEVWDIVYSNSRNDYGECKRLWERFPEDIKKAVTPDLMREIAMADDKSLSFYRKEVWGSYQSSIGKKRNSIMVSSKGLGLDLLDNEFYENGELPFYRGDKINQIENKEQDTEESSEDDVFVYQSDDPNYPFY